MFLLVEYHSLFPIFSSSYLRLRIQKLSKNYINDVSAISETELWNNYFDSLLSCALANSERSVLLRWLDKVISPSLPLRPDAVISIVGQLKFSATLGHGEVKIAEPTCNKAALCKGLARVACFSKEAIDSHLLESSFSFQIHGNLIFFYIYYTHRFVFESSSNFVNIGFAITFFLTRLGHDGLYVMYKIGHLEFLSSLAQLPFFIKLKT